MTAYLDYNATAPIRPEALEKMREILAFPANPSSAHSFGRMAKKHMEDARTVINEAISAFSDEIIFAASGSEANAMALRGIAGHRVLVSAIEHSSVLRHSGADIIPVDKNGFLDLAALDAALATGGPALVSVMLANNETGVIQPIADIAAICKKNNALLHTDAVQALGKIPVDFGALGCDLMTLAAHKCGGPPGAAALIARRGLPVTPLIIGGGQELNRRAGTENVAAIAGFGVAVGKMDFSRMTELRGWLDTMEKSMESAGATTFGKSIPRLPNTSCVAMPGVSGEVQLMNFDLAGFAVSAGSACSSGRIEPSHVLAAMGVPESDAKCAIRVSAGWATTEAKIKAFTEAWRELSGRLVKKAG